MCPRCGSCNVAMVMLRHSALVSCAECLNAAEVFYVEREYAEAFEYECALA